jgi:hypothetical protein
MSDYLNMKLPKQILTLLSRASPRKLTLSQCTQTYLLADRAAISVLSRVVCLQPAGFSFCLRVSPLITALLISVGFLAYLISRYSPRTSQICCLPPSRLVLINGACFLSTYPSLFHPLLHFSLVQFPLAIILTPPAPASVLALHPKP